MGFLLAVQGAASQGILWGIMALGVFITFKVLDFPDLTVDGSFALGGAVGAVLISARVDPFLAVVAAFASGCLAGAATALLHTKLKILASGTLREKIVRYLFPHIDEKGQIALKVSREFIAAYLAVSRPSLSRELSAMQREGIIEAAGRTIRILDMEQFEEYL
mgnify:CR=1 FL=1